MTVDVKAQSSGQPSGIRTAAVLLIQLISMGFVVVTPAISVFMQTFANDPLAATLPVTLISTLPTLTTVIGIFISGALLGKVKHRTIAIIATLLFTVFGALPMMFYSYGMVLVCRALCGLGLGLMNPLATAIVLGCYKGNKQASLLGYGTLVGNGGGIVLQTVGGVLAGVDPSGQLVFAAHLFGIISVVFAFFLPNPQIEDTAPSGAKSKVKIPASVWVMALCLLLFQLLNYPAMLNCGIIMMDPAHMGDSAVGLDAVGTLSAMALNCFTILGMIAGAVFGQVFKRIRKWTIALGWLLVAVGIFCVVGVPNAIVICVGLGLIGLGFNWVLPSFMTWIGVVSTPKSHAVCITCVMVAIQLGSFLSTFWLQALDATIGDSIYFPGYVELVFCVLMAVVFAFYNPFRKEGTAGERAPEA